MFIYSNTTGGRGGFGCLLVGILVMVGLYYAVRGLFYLLTWAAPGLLALALLVEWRAVADTGRSYWELLKTRPVVGLVLGGLSVVGFPFLCLFLLFKAIGYRQLSRFGHSFGRPAEDPEEATLTDYEELESRPADNSGDRKILNP
jgi:hypothetical protein